MILLGKIHGPVSGEVLQKGNPCYLARYWLISVFLEDPGVFGVGRILSISLIFEK